MPSRAIKAGPENVKIIPHHLPREFKYHRHGDRFERSEENVLNVTRIRMNGTGSWRIGSRDRVSGVGKRRNKVPCMIDCRDSNRDRSRNAGVESVASVKGKTSSICSAEESLEALDRKVQRIQLIFDALGGRRKCW
jgi:hypothetical protein